MFSKLFFVFAAVATRERLLHLNVRLQQQQALLLDVRSRGSQEVEQQGQPEVHRRAPGQHGQLLVEPELVDLPDHFHRRPTVLEVASAGRKSGHICCRGPRDGLSFRHLRQQLLPVPAVAGGTQRAAEEDALDRQ